MIFIFKLARPALLLTLLLSFPLKSQSASKTQNNKKIFLSIQEFQKLTPQQQNKYLKKIQSALGDMTKSTDYMAENTIDQQPPIDIFPHKTGSRFPASEEDSGGAIENQVSEVRAAMQKFIKKQDDYVADIQTHAELTSKSIGAENYRQQNIQMNKDLLSIYYSEIFPKVFAIQNNQKKDELAKEAVLLMEDYTRRTQNAYNEASRKNSQIIIPQPQPLTVNANFKSSPSHFLAMSQHSTAPTKDSTQEQTTPATEAPPKAATAADTAPRPTGVAMKDVTSAVPGRPAPAPTKAPPSQEQLIAWAGIHIGNLKIFETKFKEQFNELATLDFSKPESQQKLQEFQKQSQKFEEVSEQLYGYLAAIKDPAQKNKLLAETKSSFSKIFESIDIAIQEVPAGQLDKLKRDPSFKAFFTDFEKYKKQVLAPSAAVKSAPQEVTPTEAKSPPSTKPASEASKDSATSPDGRFFRCMYAGFIIKQDPCKGPTSVPEDMKISGLNADAIVCESPQVLCNPLIFGLSMESSCEVDPKKPAKDQKCIQSAKPLCVNRGAWPTFECAKISDDKARSVAATLIQSNPETYKQYTENFTELCDKEKVDENLFTSQKNGKRRKNKNAIMADIRKTCGKAKEQIAAITEDFLNKEAKPASKPVDKPAEQKAQK